MNAFFACFKKELLGAWRTQKILILGIVFLAFGVMNPAIAKLTPWIAELLADQLAEAGMLVGAVTVDAASSWAQFVKNIPLALVVYVIVCGGIFTREYAQGTLVLLVTKGMPRRAVLAAKAAVLALGWTAGYALCVGVTYAYNAYFWDNGVMANLWQIVLGWWAFGLWVLSLVVLFSAVGKSTSAVLLGTLGGVAASWLVGLVPHAASWVPTSLMAVTDGDIAKALCAACVLIAAALAAALPIFAKREL